jgi:MarR family transcriptional regulator, organic hydroperoxide resistance regulator
MTSREPPGPGQSPGFLLWRVGLRWQSLLARRLERVELTPAQFTVLAALLWLERARGAEGLPMQRDVAEHAGTDPMMTSQLLRALEARGLIERRDDANDLRARRVRTTTSGARAATDGIALAQEASREFFDAALGDARPFVASLRRLAEAGGAELPGPLDAAAARGGDATRSSPGRKRRRRGAR